MHFLSLGRILGPLSWGLALREGGVSLCSAGGYLGHCDALLVYPATTYWR